MSNSNTFSIMGKSTSMWGKTTGKVGGLVYASSGGEQIVREYNPNVANPSTQAQVDQRARMKLMSQLSAQLAPVVAMRKDGLVSARNKFVKKNFESSYALNGVAQISYENVQLTEGSTGLPQITVNAYNAEIDGPVVSLASAPSANVSRVVYCIFEKTQENRLSLVTSSIATQRAASITGEGYFPLSLTGLEISGEGSSAEFAKEYVIYAYGMSDTSERATARYGNLNVQSASDIATLVANRTISFEDYQFTQTRGTTAGQGTGGDTPVPEGQARVFVTALGDGGTVSGGGTFALGSQVTVVATPNAQYTFRAWVKNGTSQVVSTSASYTFTLNGQTDLLATFDFVGNESL